MAMTLVSTVTVGSGGAASIEFTNIPQTGKDLLLVVSARNEANAGEFRIEINSDTSNSNYPIRFLEGSGSAAITYALTANPYFRLRPNNSSQTADTFSSNQIYVANYSATSNKSVSVDSVTENNATAAYQVIGAASYNGTSGMSSIKMTANSGNLAQHTSASVYLVS